MPASVSCRAGVTYCITFFDRSATDRRRDGSEGARVGAWLIELRGSERELPSIAFRRLSEDRSMAHLFAKQASTYALGRAIYPPSLFSFLASLTPHSHSLAWDVGTGNGQAALLLADHYEKVIATDASEQQILHAVHHPKVTYATTPSQLTEHDVKNLVGDGTVDLILCAQALHWFDLDTFYGHARRVLRNPGGVIAAWAYGNPSVSPAVDAVLETFAAQISQEWAPPIRYIKEGYTTLPFPFAPVVSSNLTTTGPFPFECAKEATLDEFLTHLRSWSAVQKAIDSGRDVWSERQQALFADAWEDSPRRTVKWTLHTLIGTLLVESDSHAT